MDDIIPETARNHGIRSFKSSPHKTKPKTTTSPPNNNNKMFSLLPSPPRSAALKPETMSAASRRSLSLTSIHIMALDSIVNVNSLFTLALFLGLTWYPTTDPRATLIGASESCAAGADVAEGLISFHVYSFSSFLFSSLIALALKQAIKISKSGGSDGGGGGEGFQHHLGHVNRVALRLGMMVSAFGSVFGCGFLMMALVDLVQIKLGVLACGGFYTYCAIVPLVVLVPLALFIYVSLVFHAFTR